MVAESLAKNDIGALVVAGQDGELRGLVSERDLVRALARLNGDVASHIVTEVMTKDVITCTNDDDIVETLALMNEKKIRHVPVFDSGRLHAMVSIRDFEHACKQLQAEADTDGLTGLANRRCFMKTMVKEIGRRHRFQSDLSVAMIDIDLFKNVNDTFGHAAGDQVLCSLAKLLVHEFRVFDGIGRLGGEEFAVLFPHTRADEAATACERLLATLRSEEVVTDQGAIRYSVSVGVTQMTDVDSTGASILNRADELLYKAKAAGRNRVVTDQSRPEDPRAVTRIIRENAEQRNGTPVSLLL